MHRAPAYLPALFLPALVLIGLAPLSSQRRVEEKAPPKFEETLAAAGEAWSQGHYGQCVDALQQGLQLAQAKRRDAILAALPAAPAGWSKAPRPEDEDLAGNPFAAQLAAAVGSIIAQEYRQDDGNGRVEMTITANSPMVQMFGMLVQNPQLLKQQGGEVIEYDQAKAVLTKTAGRLSLQMLLAEKHFIQIEGSGIDEEPFFALASQACIDGLEKALTL